jgi:tRNA-dihydrouridine synthase
VAKKPDNPLPEGAALERRLSVAPMMDWTDRHCRYFLRQFSPRVLLYTEMIVARAILRGDRRYLLEFDPEERPSHCSSAAPSPPSSRRRPPSAPGSATTR